MWFKAFIQLNTLNALFCFPQAHTFAKLRSNCHSAGAVSGIKISLLFDSSESIFNYYMINIRIIHLIRHITFALTMRDSLETSSTQNLITLRRFQCWPKFPVSLKKHTCISVQKIFCMLYFILYGILFRCRAWSRSHAQTFPLISK